VRNWTEFVCFRTESMAGSYGTVASDSIMVGNFLSYCTIIIFSRIMFHEELIMMVMIMTIQLFIYVLISTANGQ
jgi:hypothetical protein